MLKITGVMCVLGGCFGLGCARIRTEQLRIRHLREVLRIVKRIQDEMSYGKRTIPEICEVLSTCVEEPYRKSFWQIREEMLGRQGRSIAEIWEEAMRECFCDVPLREDEKKILLDIPEYLGMQEECIQAESIVQFRELLERRLRQAEEGYDGKVRVIFSLSVLAGVFVVVILL